MKVQKKVTVPVGLGTVFEVIHALSELNIPKDAKIISIKDDLSVVEYDYSGGILPTPIANQDGSFGRAVVEITWTDEEEFGTTK